MQRVTTSFVSLCIIIPYVYVCMCVCVWMDEKQKSSHYHHHHHHRISPSLLTYLLTTRKRKEKKYDGLKGQKILLYVLVSST